MEGFNNGGVPFGDDMFWNLPVAFGMNENARDRISSMTEEERDVLRAKSSQVTSEKEMDELVRMVAEGKFE
ncbi:MAG: hypothetical protein IJ405_00210 [Lachnospiraceae bacterium]|nr:hypothetical protein [Lachnospiraceae bacterium]MBQ7780436.1 hypothetical protein [Lachnospiraceae bacterium]